MSENLARHFLLRDDVVFLNHGSFGACPREVFEAYQNWQLELERQPVAFLGRDLTDRMRVPRVALAAELGTEADNIVGLVNATEGLNIVAQSLDLQPGDEIVTTDHEYSVARKDVGLHGAPDRRAHRRRQSSNAAGLRDGIH